jgi:hypothetical protein
VRLLLPSLGVVDIVTARADMLRSSQASMFMMKRHLERQASAKTLGTSVKLDGIGSTAASRAQSFTLETVPVPITHMHSLVCVFPVLAVVCWWHCCVPIAFVCLSSG